MTPAIAMMTSTLTAQQLEQVGARSQADIAEVRPAASIETALRETFAIENLEGVSEVLLLPRNRRLGAAARHKVFVMLASSDINRDRRIVQLMCQFDAIDYNLVPESARSMLPDAVTAVWQA